MKKLVINILLLLMLAFGEMQAQTYLSLDSCRNLAITNNAQSKLANMQLQKMRFEVNAYRANFFPRISAQGMYFFTTTDLRYQKRYDLYNTNIPDAISDLDLPDWTQSYLDQFYSSVFIDVDIKVNLNNTFLVGAQFEQPIFMGGKIITAFKMAKIGKQIAQANIKRSDAEMIYKTDEAYWMYVKVIELHQTALEYKKVVENVLIDANNGAEMGMISENDKMKVQVKLGEANMMVKQTENGMRLAKMNLCMITGMNLFSSILPLDSLPDSDAVMVPEEIPDVTVRTEYDLLQKQLELKKQQVNLARSDFLPQLGITGGYNYMNGIMLNETKLLNKPSFYALASLKIPISQWGEGVNRIRSAKADVSIAEYQMEESLNLLQLEILKAYNTLDEASLKTEIAKTEFLQTQENLRIVSDRYELGFEILSTLLEAQVLWKQAWSKFIEAKADLRIAETNYWRITNSK
ncbi:MAG: TolC family protein [Bacteroidales bacterium]|jgi:outer membrane protein TolC|nr:TolC family protein [Bacteroidales bacterium]